MNLLTATGEPMLLDFAGGAAARGVPARSDRAAVAAGLASLEAFRAAGF